MQNRGGVKGSKCLMRNQACGAQIQKVKPALALRSPQTISFPTNYTKPICKPQKTEGNLTAPFIHTQLKLKKSL